MTDSRVRLQNSYNTNSQKELLGYYDNWETYEQDIHSLGYLGPVGCTAFLFKYIRQDKKILEVGCGPGNVGKHLRLMHFTDIEGLDGSQGMVNRARKSGVYNKVHHHIIDNNPLPVSDMDVLLSLIHI